VCITSLAETAESASSAHFEAAPENRFRSTLSGVCQKVVNRVVPNFCAQLWAVTPIDQQLSDKTLYLSAKRFVFRLKIAPHPF